MAMRVGVSIGTTTDVSSMSDQIRRFKLRDLPEPSSLDDTLKRREQGSLGGRHSGDGDLKIFNGHKVHHVDHSVENLAKESLRDKCIKTIVANFERLPVDEGSCAPDLMRAITGHLPLDLDPVVGALHIFDEAYWKRRCVDRFGWSHCDLMGHGQVWKQLFFETLVGDLLEDFALPPGEERHVDHLTALHHHGHRAGPGGRAKDTRSEKEKLVAKIEAAQDYLFSLRVKELRSRLPCAAFLPLLPNLSRLELTYSIRKAGMARVRLDFGMQEGDVASLAACLADGPACCPSLTTLSLPGNLLDDDHLRVLVEGLARNDTVTALDLSHNRVSNGGARLLSKLLGDQSLLASLSLMDNQVRAEGARCLGRGLRKNGSLVELNLRLNRLGDEGGRLLLEGVRAAGHRSGLSRLNLAGNGCGARTAAALGAVLAGDFGGSGGAGGMGDDPFQASGAFASSTRSGGGPGKASPHFGSSGGPGAGGAGAGVGLLGGGGGLALVDLSVNGLEAADAELLERRLARNRSLTSLDLRANPCFEAPECADAIAAIDRLARANELAAR